MKRWIGFILHLAMIVILTSFGSYTMTKKVDFKVPDSLKVDLNFEALVKQDSVGVLKDALIDPPFLGNAYNGFKEALAFKESQGRYDVVNTLGIPWKVSVWIGDLEFNGCIQCQRFSERPCITGKNL